MTERSVQADEIRAEMNEVERVAAHLFRAQRRARKRRTLHLDPIRKRVRALLLEELGRYRRGGHFPINRDFAQKTPYFIDRDGTRCAMAHLLELGGERELVARIARERNNARVRELANEPRLLAWLDAAGLTVEEAAEIQPSYCAKATDCVCTSGSLPVAGVLETQVIAVTEPAQNEARVSVVAVHGDLPLFSVGDELQIFLRTEDSSRTVLVPVLASTTGPNDPNVPGGFGLAADETYICNSAFNHLPVLSKEEYIAAVTAPACVEVLETSNPAWKQDCESRDPNAVSGEPAARDGGCSIPLGGVGAPSALGILTAILAALATRRGVEKRRASRARRASARRALSSTRRALGTRRPCPEDSPGRG